MDKHFWKGRTAATQIPVGYFGTPLQKYIGCDDAPNCPEVNLQAGCNTKAFSVNFSGDIWLALSLKGRWIYKKTYARVLCSRILFALVGQ